ncbi:ScbA/BarX family gamma-butyrolactone biosynthesis protein [Streptomyces sp. NBC_00083]|uniref:ScbA/BarX family gamma-butyrolactone biosynthesis protein n=1 Tax=Streptomyces sp. NBC_00083 TaxID=2975647 RepID=UPI0022545ADF|nr:ScbA/BarX family gamma-butyrolactone biosynthesis protein [Streptomyces sp. NBC_00083]MCX5387488.1 ScbA/BarX family gamma-butyrolactone biosynthesis protein [Streptomyces sp. NBC_00083]
MSETAVASRPLTLHQALAAPHPSAPLAAYTHLRRSESILVTGWERTGAHQFGVDAVWPKTLSTYLPYDPRILAQAVRQSGLVVAHGEYGVPLEHQTVLNALRFRISPGFRAPRDEATALRITIDVSDPNPGRRTPSSLHMRFHLAREGITVARADSRFGWISPAAYRRLRGDHIAVDWAEWPVPAPVTPARVGRVAAGDVVLAPGDRDHSWLLRNDVSNTLLFDHPVDHVPGLVLVEAAHQAAYAFSAPLPLHAIRVDSRFDRYVEFDRPCLIEAMPLPTHAQNGSSVRVVATQGGETVAVVDFDGGTH